MRLKLSKRPLPRIWTKISGAKGILLAADIAINSGRLRAKLMVFDSTKNLRHFWDKCLGRGDLGKGCKGAVNGLFREVIDCSKPKEKRWLEADPRYYCVIGLVKGWLSAEIVSHEAGHAAFNYAKRRCRSPWNKQARDFDEEAICYPLGRLTGRINDVLHDAGLHD